MSIQRWRGKKARHEERFRLLVESVEDYAIFMLDAFGNVQTWNKGAQVNKGYTAAEVLGRHFSMFFPPEDVAAGLPERELQQAVSAGSARGEGWRLRKSGERFWVGYVINTIRDAKNEVIGFAKITRDLTERQKHEAVVRQMEREIRKERDRFHAAAESSVDAIYMCTAERNEYGVVQDFVFTFLNANAEKVFLRPRSSLLGKKLGKELPAYRETGLFERYRNVIECGEPLDWEFAELGGDTVARWFRVQAVRLEDGLAITQSNITERKNEDLELRKSAAFTEGIFASSPFPTFVTSLTGRVVSINHAAETMLGYRREELVGLDTPMLLLDQTSPQRLVSQHHERSASWVPISWETLTANPLRGLVEEAEAKMIRRDGSKFDAQITVCVLTGSEGTISGFVLVAYDITERKRQQEHIAHMAHHDALTGLPSRALLHDRLAMAIRRADRQGSKLSLLMVDLDHFKRINDLHGHVTGDEVLRTVAQRLLGAARSTDTVARIGGDEFVVLLGDITSAPAAEEVGEKIIAALSLPLSSCGYTFTPTVSVGVCTYPDDAGTSETLLINADTAMYESKAAGRNCITVYDKQIEAASIRRRGLEAHIGNALENDEFELLYQPQVCLRTGLVTGVEALLRWRSKSLGLILPGEFIPLIEENGMIVPVGRWVLLTACKQVKELQTILGRPLGVAVNVSPMQFLQSRIAETVFEALHSSALEPHLLELEITENLLIDEAPRHLKVLERVRAEGVHVAIDDFGTGFSSMSYILRFRVDRIKIDQSFIRAITACSTNSAVTEAIIVMSRSLGIPVIAEGVETTVHRDLLVTQGCDHAQGYLFSRPVPLDDLPRVIRNIESSRMHDPGVSDLSSRTDPSCEGAVSGIVPILEKKVLELQAPPLRVAC